VPDPDFGDERTTKYISDFGNSEVDSAFLSYHRPTVWRGKDQTRHFVAFTDDTFGMSLLLPEYSYAPLSAMKTAIEENGFFILKSTGSFWTFVNFDTWGWDAYGKTRILRILIRPI
jgi:hypothetical protein